MKYRIEETARFKRDFKWMLKQRRNIERLRRVVSLLADGEKLPAQYSDHILQGDYVGFRECHVEPDWLLVYKIQDDVLALTLQRTGSHSELFR